MHRPQVVPEHGVAAQFGFTDNAAGPHTLATTVAPTAAGYVLRTTKLHFFGGPRAELATPDSCGTFTTTSELTPWSAPGSGPAATPSDSFVIDEGCPGGFSPSFSAGSTNLQAGGYTPFVVSFLRSDTDQELAGLTVTLPPGLLAKISGVPLCPEAEANAGTCPEDTQVGTTGPVSARPEPLLRAGQGVFDGCPRG